MEYSLGIIKLYSGLPKTVVTDVIGRQMLRSGTSVGAQYREACRARSKAEFSSKMESSLQELEETGYWIELLERSGFSDTAALAPMKSATLEIKKIMIASINTVKSGMQASRTGKG